MKQYTDEDQTAKLIELGFPKPQSIVDILGIYNEVETAYSIGELIEFLPERVNAGLLDVFYGRGMWFVRYENRHVKEESSLELWSSRELIDALFCACVTLKEKGVI